MNNLDRRTALRRLAIGASAAFGSAAFPGLTKAAAKTASAAGKVAGGGPKRVIFFYAESGIRSADLCSSWNDEQRFSRQGCSSRADQSA